MILTRHMIKLIEGRCVCWLFNDVFKTEAEAKRKAVKAYVAGANGARVIKSKEGLYAVLTWEARG